MGNKAQRLGITEEITFPIRIGNGYSFSEEEYLNLVHKDAFFLRIFQAGYGSIDIETGKVTGSSGKEIANSRSLRDRYYQVHFSDIFADEQNYVNGKPKLVATMKHRLLSLLREGPFLESHSIVSFRSNNYEDMSRENIYRTNNSEICSNSLKVQENVRKGRMVLEEDVIRYRKLFANSLISTSEIMKQFGVSKSTTLKILKGKSYSEISGPIEKLRTRKEAYQYILSTPDEKCIQELGLNESQIATMRRVGSLKPKRAKARHSKRECVVCEIMYIPHYSTQEVCGKECGSVLKQYVNE